MVIESIALMTLFDLLIIGACSVAIFTRLRHRKAIVPGIAGAGFYLVTGALLLIGLFYLADLVTAHVLPWLVGSEAAMAVMRRMHMEYIWYVMALSILALVCGLTRNLLSVSAVITSSRTNSARFHDIAEVAGDWIWEMDENLRFSYLSDRFFDLFHFKPEDIIGKTRVEFASEDAGTDHWKKHLDDLENHRKFRDFDYCTRRPDGPAMHIRISGKPVFDQFGVFKGYRGTGTDRTAEVVARQGLEESEKQFRDLIEGSIQGVLIHTNWEILFANQALADILGYTCHLEILDHGRVENLLAPNEIERLKGYMDARMAGDQAPETYECECLKKNGARIWAEFRNTVTMWRGQKAILCVVIDITERKQAEAALQKQNEELRRRDQELRDQNERFNAALDNMTQGLAMFDKDSRLIVCNERFAEVYGLRPEHLRPGMSVRDIIELRISMDIYAGDSPDAYLRERLEWVASDQQSCQLQRLNNGRYIEIRRKMLSDGGWLATHEDVTERKKAEQVLRTQNEELRRRDQELRDQNERFNLALENMTQGLAMFDKDARLIVCNERYSSHYGLTPDLIKPGMTLRQVLELRIANNVYGDANPETYLKDTLEWASCGKRSRKTVKLSCGRIMEVLHQPMSNGGWLTTHDDITERMKAETALKGQNVLFNAALDNMSQGLCMFDGDQRLIVSNQRYAQMYDLPPEIMKPGITLREILEHRIANGIYAGTSPDDYIRERMAWVSSGQRSSKVQELSDGRSIAITHQPMAEGGWLTTHEDVTERRKAEAQNLMLARIVEDSINEVYVFDAETLNFLLVNASACQNLGYTMDELRKKTPVDLKPEISPEEFQVLLAPLIAGEKDHIQFETVHRRKDGSRYEVEVVLQQISFQDRSVFAAIIEDVTERNEAMRALRENEELFSKAFHVSPALCAISRPEDGAHYDVNEAWMSTLGYSRGEALAHSAVELGIWADPQERRRFVDELRARGSVRGFEATLRTRQGHLIDCLVSGEYLEVGGEPRLFVVSEDITKRKRAETELIAHRDHLQVMVDQATAELMEKAEQLEQALEKEKRLNELQRQFVSTASHEFRTPLAIIDSSVQRLLRSSDELTREKLEMRARRIRDAVKLMSTLMESTLTAALMDAGKIRVKIEPCDLKRVIAHVCSHQLELHEDREIVAHLGDLPDEIESDSAALNQVFTNLLSNAVKYSNDSEITIDGARHGDWVVISVRDRGIGIDEDDLPHMFSRFFRAKTSAGIAGTGIGLNLVKTLVEMLGGSITVESVKGEGSVFSVRLPIRGVADREEASSRVA